MASFRLRQKRLPKQMEKIEDAFKRFKTLTKETD